MAFVDIQVSPVVGCWRRLSVAILSNVLVVHPRQIGIGHAQIRPQPIRAFPHRMDARNQRWPHVSDHTLALESLPVAKNTRRSQHRNIGLRSVPASMVETVSSRRGALIDPWQPLRNARRASGGCYPAIGNLADDFLAPRAVGGEHHRYRVFDIEKLIPARVGLRVNQAYPSFALPFTEQNILSRQQSFDLRCVLYELIHRQGGKPHCVASRVAGAESDNHATGSNFVDCRSRRCRDRCQSVARNADKSSQLDS